jgi:hypothetical protein
MESKYFSRGEASDFLCSKGLRVAKTTLQKFATIGGGPAYQRFGSRCVYTESDLNTWAMEKLKKPVRSTSGRGGRRNG